MKDSRNTIRAVMSIWLAVPSAAVLAQGNRSAAPSPEFSLTSHLVLVDVVVRQDGRPICGLTQQDFAVLEDGRPQAIQSFDSHCASREPAKEAPPLPRDIYTNLPTADPQGAVNVLLLDGLNTHARDQMRSRVQMVESLRMLPRGQRIAIFTLGSRLRMLTGFTTDTSTLIQALDGLKPAEQSTLLGPERQTADEDQVVEEIRQMPGGAAIAEETKEFLNATDNQQTGNRIAATLTALQQLARYLDGIPGRKNLLWFSGAFPLATFQSLQLTGGVRAQPIDRSYAEDVKRTACLLAEARVAVYPIDVRGVISEPIYDLRQEGSIGVQDTLANQQQDALERMAERSTLDVVAQETGGHATYENNDLARAATRAMEDGSDYYTIAYSPADRKFNGAWRKIRVNLIARAPRSKYELGYRNGYFAIEDDQRSPTGGPSNSFAAAMRQGMPASSQILFDVQVKAEAAAPTGAVAGQNAQLQHRVARYRLDFAAALRDLSLSTEPDGTHAGAIVVEAQAFNREGLVVNSTRDAVRYQLDAEQWSKASAKGLQIHQQLDLPEGSFSLRVGLCDPVSGRFGALEIPLHVSLAKTAASGKGSDASP